MVATADVRPSRLNPRKDFRDEELAELAESIRSKGLVQPIIVRPAASGYEIVAGERRWRAAQKAGLHTVPVIARDLTDKEVLELAIIENVQRADLNAIEEASGYRELIERFDYSQEQLSEIIGKSRSHVANTLRLLKLPEGVQTMVQDGRLTAGHARALIGRGDAEALAQRILSESLNVREVEALVQGGDTSSSVSRTPREKDPDTKAFEKELANVLGLKVEIKRGSGESGHLIIKYGNFDQLDYIRMRLVGANG
jgi:ParB family chromosome partitioning protein